MVYRDPAVQALQFLECIDSKDTNQKAQFFRNSLVEVLPIIPKVNQLDSDIIHMRSLPEEPHLA